jgi:chromate transporter
MVVAKMNTINPSPSDITAKRPRVSLLAIFVAYLRVGATAFGFTILQALKSLALGRGWLTEDEFNEGVALVQMYPGPIMMDLTAYVGYKLRGVPGAVLATIGFVLPTYVLMLILSALYFASGSLPWVHPLFLGLEALVVGVVLNVTLDLAGRNVQSRASAAIAVAAFAALLFKMNAVLIVLAALALGALFIRPEARGAVPSSTSLHSTQSARRRWLGIGVVIAVVLAGVAFAWSLHSEVGTMGLVFFKIGSVAFGNGTTIIPLIQADVVDTYHWLSLNQFADGIALGQVTPGPFLITAAFVGYKLGGIFGATLATFAIFSPSFAMTLVFTELFGRVRNLKPIRGALAGVLASFVGLLVVVLLQLGGIALTTPARLVFAAAAFVAVRFFRLDIVWVFVGGIALWIVMLGLGAA